MLTIELKTKFCHLAGQLSPENISCDGELSRAQVKKRYTAIMKQWRELEKQAGRAVSEDETYKWWDEVQAHRRAEDQKILKAEGSHPLLEHNSIGVWKRVGANRMSAYYVQGAGVHGEPNVFRLYSEFKWIIGDKELIGQFDSLNDAAQAGEEFLKTITREAIKAKIPTWSDAVVDREMKRLPG